MRASLRKRAPIPMRAHLRMQAHTRTASVRFEPDGTRLHASHVTVPSATPGQDRLEPGGVVNAQAVPQPRRTQAGVPTGSVKVALGAPTFQRELRSHAAQPRQQLATNRSSERDGSLMFILVHCGVQHDRLSGTARQAVKNLRISAIVTAQTHG